MPGLREKTRATLAVIALALLQNGGAAFAQTASAAGVPAASGVVSKRLCVDVEVGDEHVLSYDCLSRQLAPRTGPDTVASQSAAEALADGPSNRVGTFNLSAERNRFGANWGKSAYPQRPQQPLPVTPSGR